ncbi:DUF2807 domain-containing protein [Hanstruepera neustonica]|uniref:DUF2807 domain-containing protein n=1 Tax=Hanstruepera neustonica TaxID=1445657 RepID=A0A2K1E0V5_9FLAO|nr:head GIN domain-containing protein [Hanstruepera neustonica]PNQ73920.1 DUF2807 domain-containing protein [Hanstruepera neustonica]
MKKLIYILFVSMIVSCSKENANDCIQNAGNIIQQEVPVSEFDKILVNRDVELIVKEAFDYQVIIETGEYLLNDVEARVVDNELQLIDHNTCNYVREYGITKVYVSAPNIRTIRTSSQYTVKSDGVLNYQTLNLLSEDFNATRTFTVGDYNLQVNTNNLRIVSNNISSFYISGETNNLTVEFYSGAGRFEGAHLIAQNVEVYHRGSNDMIVNPQQSLSGELVGTGDLISVNRPPTVEVEQLYTGRLIFN